VRRRRPRIAAALHALDAETLTLERRLAESLKAAYGLTPADVDLLWRTASPRMPTRSTPGV
jgi:hypothetical protein